MDNIYLLILQITVQIWDKYFDEYN